MSERQRQHDGERVQERRKRLPRTSEVELRKLLPNLLTTGAFFSGVAAIFFAHKYNATSATASLADPKLLAQAIGLMGLSFVLDGLDGRLARMLRVSSQFGARLDSISDFVAFGLAPAFILFKWGLYHADELGFAVVGIYSLCAAIRLARFAAQAARKPLHGPVARTFVGLPAPAAGFIVLIPVMLWLSPHVSAWAAKLKLSVSPSEVWVRWVVLAYVLLIAGLMVSKFPMLSVKHIRVSRKVLTPLMVATGLLAAALFVDAWLTLTVLACVYLLSMPLAKRFGTLPEASPGSAPPLGSNRS
jgi:CDP-diacylglycerol---serine O-phosphatidyltransferase